YHGCILLDNRINSESALFPPGKEGVMATDRNGGLATSAPGWSRLSAALLATASLAVEAKAGGGGHHSAPRPPAMHFSPPKISVPHFSPPKMPQAPHAQARPAQPQIHAAKPNSNPKPQGPKASGTTANHLAGASHPQAVPYRHGYGHHNYGYGR